MGLIYVFFQKMRPASCRFVQTLHTKTPDNQAHVKKGERWFFLFPAPSQLTAPESQAAIDGK